MKAVGGNVTAALQLKSATAKNDIGEVVPGFTTLHTLTGWLDYSSGESNRTSFDAKIQESTHIFICDYVALDSRITAETSRMVINTKNYDVLLIDNPMELNRQLEIYLKYTGA